MAGKKSRAQRAKVRQSGGSVGAPGRRKRARALSRKRKAARAKAGPLPKRSYVDLPGRRYRELIQDRRFGSEGQNLAGLKLRALMQRSAPKHLARGTPFVPGASNWVPLGPSAIPNGQTYGGSRVLVSGRVAAIVVDPVTPTTLFLAAARGGIWKSLDAGQNWSPMSDNEASLAIGVLAMAPSDNNRLYAGTGEGNIFYYAQDFPLNSINEDYHGIGLLQSQDGGQTWTHLGASTFTGAAFYRLAVHPTDPNTLLAATTFGLHRSQDGGASWTAMTSGLPSLSLTVLACTDVVYDPTNADRAWCAFWGSGVYRTDNANAAVPAWSQLTTGLPGASLGRISLGVAPSNHDAIFALVATSSDSFNGVYGSTDGGDSWGTVTTSATIQVFGAYTSNIAVDVSTPDVLYVSGVELYKCVFSAGAWTVTNVGGGFHPDNHAFASHPTNNLQIYAGSDGGIYQSADGGTTWNDSINQGLAITQFEFIGQHPLSDSQIIGGTQDNGTEMYRNSVVFYHSADGDGGQAGIDASNPNNVIHTYYTASPERSTQGGKFGTYVGIAAGLAGSSLFYPPWDFDATNSNNVAFGLTQLQLSAAQGTDNWPTAVALPSIGTGRVSAITYVNSSLIYCATSNGLVYKAVFSGGSWSATLISTASVPARWIWDVALVPGATDVLVIVMAGFGTPHVWQGVGAPGGWTWTDISGTAGARLPDAPANALILDPMIAGTLYVATDVGVYRSTDSGTTWSLFNDGLPNVAVYDLKLHAPTRLLRAAAHGRGFWERQLDITTGSDVRIVVRDHIMDTGRQSPSPSGLIAAWDDPTRQVNLNDALVWWTCADVKIDAPVGGSYQLPVSAVDYLGFETLLTHRDPQRGVVNRVYVQVHNRGVVAASGVTVKILYADASPGLPDLPSDFWTRFPADSLQVSPWTPIGVAQTIATLQPAQPAILEWDWIPPVSTATHSCILVVSSCSADPLSTVSLNIATLVPQNRQAGLKNLHIIDALPSPRWAALRLWPTREADVFRIRGLPPGWTLSIVFAREARNRRPRLKGLRPRKLTIRQQVRLKKQLGRQAETFDVTRALALTTPARGGTLSGIPRAKHGILALFGFAARATAKPGIVHVLQETGKRVVGGNTFVLESPKGKVG